MGVSVTVGVIDGVGVVVTVVVGVVVGVSVGVGVLVVVVVGVTVGVAVGVSVCVGVIDVVGVGVGVGVEVVVGVKVHSIFEKLADVSEHASDIINIPTPLALAQTGSGDVSFCVA